MTRATSRSGELYRNPDLSVEERVGDLMGRMTLPEKLAQLGSCWAIALLDDGSFSAALAEQVLAQGIGQVTRPGGSTSMSDGDVARLANDIQHHLLTRTRLGIPAILHEESLHGYLTRDAPVFPQALGMAATWDPELVESGTRAIGRYLRAAGCTQALSPVLDLGTDPRWGRIEETFGEDPVLVAEIGAACVRGLQAEGVVATLKHLVGHAAPEGGRNRGPVHVGERELRDEQLYPFEVAVRRERAGSVMPAYNDVDGVPCVADQRLLTGLLREAWGFDGIVVSDYNGVEELVTSHRLATGYEEAAARALRAGVDVELPATVAYGQPLRRALESGAVREADVDRAVERVLAAKVRAGLFERPYVTEPDAMVVGITEQRRLAYQIAERSLVLLTNRRGLLPLGSPESIAVVGPLADSRRELLGDYSHVAHIESLVELRDMGNVFDVPVPDDLVLDGEPSCPTILEAVRQAFPGSAVAHAAGCGLHGDDGGGIDAAARLAAMSEVAVVVVGDRSGLTDDCTTGEARDRLQAGLPGRQEQLVHAVVATGTPTVVVTVSGRPPSLPSVADHADAMLHAWVPGDEGARAVAEVLAGRAEPGGRLPVTVLRHYGQVPLTYRHRPSGGRSQWKGDYVDGPSAPLFPFGHGLSYTSFELADLTVPAEVPTDGVVEVALTARNSGDRAGSEVVQVYVRDEAAQVTRPVRELVSWCRVHLEPAGSGSVMFRIPAAFLAFTGLEMRRLVEPGTHTLWVGRSSADLALHGRFELVGPTRVVADRSAHTPSVSWRRCRR